MFERTNRWTGFACLAIVVVWYPLWIWLLGFSPSAPTPFGTAFNSMAEHLLMGRFDVDPDAIDAEGFDVDGRTVSYFGIFCAAIRIPLVLLPGFAKTDVTGWSCLIAVWLAVWFQWRAIALSWRARPRQNALGQNALGQNALGQNVLDQNALNQSVDNDATASSRRAWLTAGLLISVFLGGQHIQFLRVSIYQEPINWAFAFAMAFVWLIARGLTLPGDFDLKTLSSMAICAGLALLTRVSFGIGLYAALGLFLLVRVPPRSWIAPACVLLTFMMLTGIVNQGRWGSPFIFADFSRFNLSLDATPERLGHLAAYGTFHPARIRLGLSYYFVPIWTWIRADGHVLFAETQATFMDAMELPPGSFLPHGSIRCLGLAAVGVFAVRDRGRAALLLGLSVPPVLMLCAISMAHRYRAEFYPFLFCAALFGIDAISRWASTTRRFRVAVIASVLMGVIASHGMAVLDARSPWGPGESYLERYGLIGTYTRPPR